MGLFQLEPRWLTAAEFRKTVNALWAARLQPDRSPTTDHRSIVIIVASKSN
jgi:hypothetical protein